MVLKRESSKYLTSKFSEFSELNKVLEWELNTNFDRYLEFQWNCWWYASEYDFFFIWNIQFDGILDYRTQKICQWRFFFICFWDRISNLILGHFSTFKIWINMESTASPFGIRCFEWKTICNSFEIHKSLVVYLIEARSESNIWLNLAQFGSNRLSWAKLGSVMLKSKI